MRPPADVLPERRRGSGIDHRERVEQGVIGHRPALRVTAAYSHHEASLSQADGYLLGQPSLAHPRIAGQEYTPPASSRYSIQHRFQAGQFRLAGDERAGGERSQEIAHWKGHCRLLSRGASSLDRTFETYPLVGSEPEGRGQLSHRVRLWSAPEAGVQLPN